jgi:Fur family transcriptional regulator, ferric uptake regulator
MKEKNIKKQLKISGLKITSARLAVIGVFSNKCHPLSAENIYEKLKKSKIDLVTIYRTLISFERAGILRKVELHKDAQFYEINEDHHHHIICNSCGLIEELDGCNIERLISKISSKSSNFNIIKDHSLEFFGLCKKCAV